MAAYTTIDKPTDYFETLLYTGNGGTNNITGLDYQPDWVWIKSRGSAGENHYFFDAIRGVTKYIHCDTNAAESTNSATLTTFGSGGFTVGANNSVNKSSDPLVSWNWDANGAGSSNTVGYFNSTVSVNTTSGVSIVKFTSSGSGGTVGHGIGVVPKAIIFKRLDAASDWAVYHEATGNVNMCFLNTTTVSGANASVLNSTSPTSTLFTVGSSNIVTGGPIIAYCFAEKQGFSKIGSYLGTASTDGAFVYTGFKPAFVLIKNTQATEAWFLYDNKRGVNGAMTAMFPDEAAAEGGAANNIDLLSNGFKLRTAGAILNSAATFIYIAFAENPFVTSTGIPTPAR